MRKIVVVLVAALLALALAGCGGGEAATPAADAPAVDAPVAAATPPAQSTDRSPIESGTPEPFPAIESTAVPAAIQSKLDAKRPMALYFYDSTLPESKTIRAELDAVLQENRGLIDLVTFDLGATKGGVATESARLGAALAGDLRVVRPPYIILVDGNGFITWRFMGYVDREMISREVLRATE
ncbi:MAG: hypothetical protein CVT59_09270 [Actinobacteria bacterium HGW-Actinobacteria-1]|jgi:hypothetical protein|nr:MAG: hypothetical protein CVT59_09270 [Actinobacteria bacterium HGW-Actinobacteria-1]